MQAHVLGSPRRRRRAGNLDMPVNGRLYRVTLAGALLVVLAVSFTVTRPQALPAPPPPAFDSRSAAALAGQLASEYPDRAPGTPGADSAASWVAARLASYGYTVNRDHFEATVPGRGRVPLLNLIAVRRGQTARAIVVTAHRDDAGTGPGADVNASGTAALLELARLYGSAPATAGGGALQPTHTLIFVSTDGGASGSLGADHYAAGSSVKARTLAVVNLAATGGHARPRIDFAGGGGRSPAPALVATAMARIHDISGHSARHTGIFGQLVDLAFPLTLYDQGPFRERGIPALTLTTANVRPPEPFGDGPETLSVFREGQVGSAAQSLIDSIDQGLVLDTNPSSYVLVGSSRIVAGWAVETALIALTLPVLLATLDMLRRRRRLMLSLEGATRAQGRRLGFWLYAVVLFWLFAGAGLWIDGEPRPLSPFSPAVTDWPLGPIALYLLLLAAGWFVARLRLAGTPPEPGEEVAGYTLALVVMLGVAAAALFTNPYVLLFVLPSLHAWLWLPQVRAGGVWLRAALYATGFVGPLLLLGSLAIRFGLGLDAPWYLAELAAVGWIPPVAVLASGAWLAAAAQVGTLAFGRYAPYPGRRERRRVGAVALARRFHLPASRAQ